MRAPAAPGLEIMYRLDPTIWDGRFANNGWLQEMPKPITKLTWDNAAFMSLNTARRGPEVEARGPGGLRHNGRSVLAPVWIQPEPPGQGRHRHLGYGRTLAGRVAAGADFNANLLRTAEAPAFGFGLEVFKTGRKYNLALARSSTTRWPATTARARCTTATSCGWPPSGSSSAGGGRLGPETGPGLAGRGAWP